MKATYRNRAQALNGAYLLARSTVRRKLANDPNAHFVTAEWCVSPLPNGRWEVSLGGKDTDPGCYLGMHGIRQKETA